MVVVGINLDSCALALVANPAPAKTAHASTAMSLDCEPSIFTSWAVCHSVPPGKNSMTKSLLQRSGRAVYFRSKASVGGRDSFGIDSPTDTNLPALTLWSTQASF